LSRPDRWPATLAEICQSVSCKSGLILQVDLEKSRHKFAHSWGLSPEWQERYSAFSDILTGFYSLAFSGRYHLDGEPLIMSSFQALIGSNGRHIYDDLRRTLDITDVMQTVVLREARRPPVTNIRKTSSPHWRGWPQAGKSVPSLDLLCVRTVGR
jgi:hypothetical protein